VLNLLRWGADIRPWTDLPLPSEDAKKAGLREQEIKMAEQLVEDMSADWDPADYKDEFKDEILRLVDRKVAAGQTETVTQPEAEESQGAEGRGAKIIDLTELLQRSLRQGGGGKATVTTSTREKPGRKAHGSAGAKSTGTAARKRSTAAKAASTRRSAA